MASPEDRVPGRSGNPVLELADPTSLLTALKEWRPIAISAAECPEWLAAAIGNAPTDPEAVALNYLMD